MPPVVPDETAAPDRSPRDALVSALFVRRYARLAVVFGAVLAACLTLLFVVVLPGGLPGRPAVLYLALAFVVFVTSSMLALLVLVGRRVLRLAVHPASVVRHCATVGLVAGAAWLATAVSLQLGPAPLPSSVVDLVSPWAALLTPVGIWAVYTRYKRTVGARRVAAVAALAAVVGALAIADFAAFDLLELLPDVGRGVDDATLRLFRLAAVALVGGQAALAVLALPTEPRIATPLALGGLPLAGLAGYVAAGPGRGGLGVLAAGLGCCWLVVGWRLRAVSDDAVPEGPPTEFGSV